MDEVLAVCCTQDERGGSDGNDGSIFKVDAVNITKDVIHIECAGVARSVAKDVLQFSLLVLFDCDDTVEGV